MSCHCVLRGLVVPSAVARIRQDLLLSIIVLEPKLRESNLESLDPFDVFFHCLGVKEVAAGGHDLRCEDFCGGSRAACVVFFAAQKFVAPHSEEFDDVRGLVEGQLVLTGATVGPVLGGE